uniref:UDP-glucuronosyltransferase n=1 Tax=Cacopsylla melanoneura TaxID=428564 RepID=A0A8D8T6A1_9HEMI
MSKQVLSFNMNLFSYALLLLSFLSTLYCDKILVFLPLPIWSHHMQYERVWTALAERGHEVTLYSSFPPKANLTNLKHVNIRLPKFEIRMKGFNPAELTSSVNEILGSLFLWDFGFEGTTETYGTAEFKSLMSSKKHFDLVVTESFFASESLLALGHRFKAPNIVICSFGVAMNSLDSFGSPNLPSFMPDFRTQYSDQMSFFQRFRNFNVFFITRIMEYIYYYPKVQGLIDEHFGKDYPSLYSMMSNVSLSFLYTNPSMAPVAPLVPNMVRVGGIHLKKPGKLPTDLQKRADAAKNGFIYMSFGSVVDPAKLNEKIKFKLLNFLKEIKVPVFWKIDLTNDPVIKPETLPGNVFIQKWYPQADILDHPNLRLFITHGGISSLMEAIFLGVPVMGIPFFGDQYSNLMLLKNRGYALVEPIHTLSQESLLQQTQLMLNDPGFRNNAKKWSLIFNDELSAPLDRAVYWTEHVLRHKGAPHLSSYSRHLSWYQMYSVDVILTMLALVYAVVKLLTMCCCRAGSSKKSADLAKKKN